jgi:hypothetical protein
MTQVMAVFRGLQRSPRVNPLGGIGNSWVARIFSIAPSADQFFGQQNDAKRPTNPK